MTPASVMESYTNGFIGWQRLARFAAKKLVGLPLNTWRARLWLEVHVGACGGAVRCRDDGEKFAEYIGKLHALSDRLLEEARAPIGAAAAKGGSS